MDSRNINDNNISSNRIFNTYIEKIDIWRKNYIWTNQRIYLNKMAQDGVLELIEDVVTVILLEILVEEEIGGEENI